MIGMSPQLHIVPKRSASRIAARRPHWKIIHRSAEIHVVKGVECIQLQLEVSESVTPRLYKK